MHVSAHNATILGVTERDARWVRRLMVGEALWGAVALAGGVWLVALAMAMLMISGYLGLKKRGP